MKKRFKLFIAGLGIFGAVLFLLFYTIEEKQPQTYEYSQDYVQMKELPALLDFYYYTAQEWEEKLTAEGFKDIVTYDAIEWLLGQTGCRAYVAYDTQEGTVTREKWNQIYAQMLDFLDTDGEIYASDEVVLKREEDQISCATGTYRLDIVDFDPKPMTAMGFYIRDGRLIGIKNMKSGSASVANVYVTSAAADQISFLKGGDTYELSLAVTEPENTENHICDLIWENGVIAKILLKKDTIRGNLLAISDASLEIEGYGEVERGAQLPVYKTYGTVEEKSLSDIVIANMAAEYVIAGDCVEAILLPEPAQIAKIRVLLLSEDGAACRKDIHIKANKPYRIYHKAGTTELPEGTLVHAGELFAQEEANTIRIEPAADDGLLFLCDGSGKKISNGYRGSFELRRYQEGFAVVNELAVEQYLCAVVPSEMPASYEPEALKAQAVCARSYAYIQLEHGDYAAFGAHVDDTTNYQVYNKQKRDKKTTNAVLDTAGMVIRYQGKTAEAYYFSTSAGITGDGEAWNLDGEASGYLHKGLVREGGGMADLSSEEAFAQFLADPGGAYEREFPFFRWRALGNYAGQEAQDKIASILKTRRKRAPEEIRYFDAQGQELEGMKKFGALAGIEMKQRSVSGVILQMQLTYENGTVLVGNEYNIRAVLGAAMTDLVLADGSTRMPVLLPSAYAIYQPLGDGAYQIDGGGYGHGIGMSQNGAQAMAKSGKSCEEILNFFFQGIELGNGAAQ